MLDWSAKKSQIFSEFAVCFYITLSCNAYSVLNSERAIEVNIQIVRIFTQIREMLLTHKDILLKLEQLERKAIKQDNGVKLIFEVLKKLLNSPYNQEKNRV